MTDEALAEFERAMCERAKETARSAGQAIQEVFSPTGLEHSLQWEHVQQTLHLICRPGAAAAMPFH